MVDISVPRAPRTDPSPHTAPPPATTPVSPRARVWLLIVACMAVALVVSSMIALNTALGDIAVDTSASQAQLTWVIDGYTLVMACLLLPAGAIGDRYGRRGTLLFGLAVFSLASAASVMFDSPTQIIVARAVAGLGAAFVMPSTLSLLTSAYPKEERNKAVGIWSGVVGSSAVVGFLGSGMLLLYWSWHSIFWSFAGAGLAIFACALTVPSSRETEDHPVDWRGAILIASALAVFVLGVLEAPHRGWTDSMVLACLGAGVLLGVCFTLVQLRLPHPLLDIRLFSDAGFATGAATITFLFFANFGFFFVAIQYIQLLMGYSAIQTAVALAPLMGPVLVLSATANWYLPRVGLRRVTFAGLVLIAIGLFALRLLEADSPYWDLAWPMLIMSFGIGLCTAPATGAIMGAAPDDRQGVASAVNDTAREVGAALGIAVAGSILAARYTDVLAPGLAGFAPEVSRPAANSLAEALATAEHLGPQAGSLAQAAQSAFLSALDSSLAVLAGVLLLAAVLVGLWAPGRGGNQLGPIRRYRSTGRHRA